MLQICQLFDKLNGKEIALYAQEHITYFWISPQCGNRACLREFANYGYSSAKESGERK